MARFAVRDVGDGAGVDDEGVGALLGATYDTDAAAGEPAGDRLGVGLVQLAAEGEEGDGGLLGHREP